MRAHQRDTYPVRSPRRASGSLLANQTCPPMTTAISSASQSCTKVAPVRQTSGASRGNHMITPVPIMTRTAPTLKAA